MPQALRLARWGNLMMWYPELIKLLHILTRVVAIALVLAGTLMLLVVFGTHSERAALHAVIFFGVAAGLAWAGNAKGEQT